jgi:cytochrome P450
MTANFIPPVARQQKPPKIEFEHPNVAGAELQDIPGKRGLPFLGVLPFAVWDPMRFATAMYERYGPIHRFRACGNWNVQLIGPEANEFVLADEAGNFSAEGGWKPVFGRHFSGGLLLRDGADHRWHRKLVASAFKQEHLRAYARIFSSNIGGLLPTWSGTAPNIYEFAQNLTFVNGYSAFLGRDAAAATHSDVLAFRYLMRAAIAVVTVPLPGTAEGRANWAKAYIERLMLPMLSAPADEDRQDLLAVLSRMIDAGLIDEEEALAHLTFVIAASFDTLSSATISTLYYLAAHPEWQDKVREELLESIPAVAEMQLDDLASCVRTEWVIKEALRLNAPAPVLWRRAVKPFSFGSHVFPQGTITGVNPMLTHLLPAIWPDPFKFDPTRFAPEAVQKRHRFSFVPFGGGAHACVGANYAYLQLRVLLRWLLEEHELRLTSSREPRWYHWPNCRPRNTLKVEFKRRSS